MIRLPVLRGTLDVLLLRALARMPMHGFELMTWLEDRSGGVLEIEDSALYQALHRMEERKLITAEWGVSDQNRRARYYRIGEAGRERLAADTTRWLDYSRIITAMLTETAEPA